MSITTGARVLAGRQLRYLLTVVLHDANRPMTVAELVVLLERDGLRVAGRPSKTVSDESARCSRSRIGWVGPLRRARAPWLVGRI